MNQQNETGQADTLLESLSSGYRIRPDNRRPDRFRLSGIQRELTTGTDKERTENQNR